MTSRTVAKWDPWVNPFQKCLIRRENTFTGHLSRYHLSLKPLKPMETRSCHQKHFSPHIVQSPFPTAEIPKILIPELILDTVDKFPEATALKCGLTGRSYKYAELHELSQRFMNSLIKAGFSHGDVIAVVMPNCPEFAVVTLGALGADLTVTFMNHAYTPGEMYHQLKDSGSVCVVSGVTQLQDVQATVAKLERTTRSKPIRKIIAMDIASSDLLPEGVARFSEAIADHVDHSSRSNKSTLNELAIMPYSSGTTGLPKGVCLSHSNIVSSVYQISLSGINMRGHDEGQDIILGLLPFFHIYGWLVISNTLKQGGQVVTLPGFKPKYLIQTLKNEKLSMLFFVPPLVNFVGNHPAIERDKHLAHVRLVVSGADLIEVGWLERLQAKLPSECVLAQGYGMTELTGFSTFPTLPIKSSVTCGAPAALTQAKIVCLDTGKTLGPNQTGELCFRGPQVMLGYNNNPKATAEMIDEEGWLRTGDIAQYDQDKHFYIEGRLKEVIKVKGFQVPPAELEAMMKMLPGVEDVAVIGVPDPVTGETPVAYVVRARGAALTEDEVIAHLAEKLAKHKQVSRVFFVDQIPKSDAGKILRKELQEWYLENNLK